MPVSVLRLRQRAWCAIWTLALRSSSLAETVYELSELALDRLSRPLFDLSRARQDGAVAGHEGLADTNRTAGKRRGCQPGQGRRER